MKQGLKNFLIVELEEQNFSCTDVVDLSSYVK